MKEEVERVEQEAEEHDDTYTSEIESLHDEILKVKEELQKETSRKKTVDPQLGALSNQVAQLKCDRDAEATRLKFSEQKLKDAHESLQHAETVLESHLTQQHNETQFHNQFTKGKTPVIHNQVSRLEQSKTLRKGQVVEPEDASHVPRLFGKMGDQRIHTHFVTQSI